VTVDFEVTDLGVQ